MLINLMSFTQFSPKIRVIKCKKMLKVAWLGNYFPSLYAEFKTLYGKTFKFVLGPLLET